MVRLASMMLVWMALIIAPACADPVGSYRVEGTNPDGGGAYSGVVTVTRTGQTYSVVWDVQGTRFVGTGLGAVIHAGKFLMGPADTKDIAISVGYSSAESFGMAMYFLKDDGRWEGVWTYGGSDKVGTEIWYPR